MKNKGISGFGAIILILIILVIGYGAYQIFRLHLTRSTIAEKVEHAAKIGYAMRDNEIINQLTQEAKETNVTLDPDSIFIDRTITDSLRIYVAYDDSASILGLFTYSKHFVVDKIKLIEIKF